MLLSIADDTSSFSFWGWSARLDLAAPLVFRYITEPPHGNPLYALQVGARSVGRAQAPALFFASDVHVSPNRQILALLGYGGEGALLHLVHLVAFRVWSRAAPARILSLTDDSITIEPWAPPGARPSLETLVLPGIAAWSPADELSEAVMVTVPWTRYRL